MKWIWIITTQLLLIWTYNVDCAKILGIFPIYSRSHFSIYRRIMKTLASRGHQVTVMSTFPESKLVPNYTDVDIRDKVSNFVDTFSVEQNNATGALQVVEMVKQMETLHCSQILQSNTIKDAVKSKSYNLLFVEMFHIPCYIPLAVELNVPLIWTISPMSGFGMDRYTGTPDNPSYIPGVTTGLSVGMNFFERLWNVLEYAIYYTAHVLQLDKMALSAFLEAYPGRNITMDDMYKKVTLVFRCGHHVLLPRPNLPNVVEIGGIHIEEQKALTKDLEEFIEGAEHGVIFFSFGTTLKASSIPESKLDIFRKAFAQIPQRVLWRCDKVNIAGFTSNVKFGTWFPQRDILAHKNVQAFISHGGLLGTYEAIYTGVPVVGIPFLYDQLSDISTLQKKGAAVSLDYGTLTVQKLLNAINEVTNNSSYRENMKHLSEIFRDAPMSPLDTAVYWTEYVIRHNGASHLRSVAADMPLYQYLLLDVIAFIFVTTCFIVFVTVALIYKICAWTKIIFRRSDKIKIT